MGTQYIGPKYDFKSYMDSEGMITQGAPGRDAGDSCHTTSAYYAAIEFRNLFGVVTDKKQYLRSHKIVVTDKKQYPRSHKIFFELVIARIYNFATGRLRRHPDKFNWWGYWDRGSRDQTRSFLIAASMTGNQKACRSYLWHHMKRCFLFTTNTISNYAYPDDHPNARLYPWSLWSRTKYFFGWRPKYADGSIIHVHSPKLPDLTLFEFWATEIRACRFWFLYPLLLVLDLHTLGSAILLKFQLREDDVLNAVNTLVHTHFIYPTPLSWLACRVTDWWDMHTRLIVYWNRQDASVKAFVPFYIPIFFHMSVKYNKN